MNVSSMVTDVMWLIQTKQLTEKEALLLKECLSRNYGRVLESVDAKNSRKVDMKRNMQNQRITTFLEHFWSYDSSEYIQNKITHGQNICRRYCWSQQLMVKVWREFFCNITLYPAEPTVTSLTADDLTEFELFLKRRTRNGKHLKNETINNIIKCGKIALKWAVRKGIISYNPVDSLTAYSVHTRERGILTRRETTKLFFNGTWKDERVRIACILSMVTGMREGEILALRKCDIQDKYILVSHTWHSKFGLKCPKNGHIRKVPLYPEVKKALEHLMEINPHETMHSRDDMFLFWGKDPFRPLSANVLTKRFNQALHSIGISEVKRIERNIVFHSWRHFHATELSGRCSEHSVQVVLGHLSPMMTRHYAKHRTEKDLENVRKAMAPVVKMICCNDEMRI